MNTSGCAWEFALLGSLQAYHECIAGTSLTRLIVTGVNEHGTLIHGLPELRRLSLQISGAVGSSTLTPEPDDSFIRQSSVQTNCMPAPMAHASCQCRVRSCNQEKMHCLDDVNSCVQHAGGNAGRD